MFNLSTIGILLMLFAVTYVLFNYANIKAQYAAFMFKKNNDISKYSKHRDYLKIRYRYDARLIRYIGQLHVIDDMVIKHATKIKCSIIDDIMRIYYKTYPELYRKPIYTITDSLIGDNYVDLLVALAEGNFSDADNYCSAITDEPTRKATAEAITFIKRS